MEREKKGGRHVTRKSGTSGKEGEVSSCFDQFTRVTALCEEKGKKKKGVLVAHVILQISSRMM